MHHFFAYVARLRYIRRWGLMRSVMPENDAEHSLQVAMIAHAIAAIGRDQYGRDCDPEHILALGVYHDVSEVITGDMPTPVKYHSQELRGAYKGVERMANERLLTMLHREAAKRGVTEITLDATEEGRRLYESMGYAASDECMYLDIGR